MTRILLIALLFALCNVTLAQTCPNGDFEAWTSHAYSIPDSGWYNSNPRSLAMADSLTVWPVTGVSGQAVHIQTAIVGVDTLQAYVINTNGDSKNGTGGVPYSQKPSTIKGYYRYNLIGSDSALLLVIFKKAGAIVSSDVIKIRGTGAMSAFTAFSYTLSLSVVPDTVILAAASSNLDAGVGIASGSWLELDQLEFGGTGITQAIPGGSFDRWVAQDFEEPNGWQVGNFGSDLSGVSKSTAHYSGNYAIQLTTRPGGGGGSAVENAFVTTGYMSDYGPKGGLPYTRMSDTLTGYYTYAPVGADTGNISINLMAAGSNIGGGNYHFSAASAWTYFQIPFSAASTPDTMRIDIQSGSWNATTPGSALRIDYLQLKSQPLPPVNINEFGALQPNVQVYPNPANDVLNFNMQGTANSTVSIKIYDLAGKVVADRSYDQSPSFVSVPVGHLCSGMYFYEIRSEHFILRAKIIKE